MQTLRPHQLTRINIWRSEVASAVASSPALTDDTSSSPPGAWSPPVGNFSFRTSHTLTSSSRDRDHSPPRSRRAHGRRFWCRLKRRLSWVRPGKGDEEKEGTMLGDEGGRIQWTGMYLGGGAPRGAARHLAGTMAMNHQEQQRQQRGMFVGARGGEDESCEYYPGDEDEEVYVEEEEEYVEEEEEYVEEEEVYVEEEEEYYRRCCLDETRARLARAARLLDRDRLAEGRAVAGMI